MCLQSYYNQNGDELELDILSEIKEIGIDKWQKNVREAMEEEIREPVKQKQAETVMAQ